MKVYKINEYCFVIDEKEMMEISQKSQADTKEFAENIGLHYCPDVSVTLLPAKETRDSNGIKTKRIKGNAYFKLLKKKPQLLTQTYKSEDELINEIKQSIDSVFH